MNKSPVLPNISSQVLDSPPYMAPGPIPVVINQPSKPCIKPKGSLLIVAVFLLVLSTAVIVFLTLDEASSKSTISGPIQLTRTHINPTDKTQVPSRDNFGNLKLLYFNRLSSMSSKKNLKNTVKFAVFNQSNRICRGACE